MPNCFLKLAEDSKTQYLKTAKRELDRRQLQQQRLLALSGTKGECPGQAIRATTMNPGSTVPLLQLRVV